jgi:hypothetical protein
VIKFLYCSLCS